MHIDKNMFCCLAGYLTIGGSHTVAYLRCIEHGLTGPSSESSTHPKSDAIWRAISPIILELREQHPEEHFGAGDCHALGHLL